MRITNEMIADNLQFVMSQNLNNLNSSFMRMSTERKFQRASDDPADALKTMQSLHSVSDIDQYNDCISEAKSWEQNTESTLNVINQVIKSAQETVTAANGSNNTGDNGINATKLEGLQDELIQTLNSNFNGRYVFGCSQSGPAPFKVGTAADGASNVGKLMFYDYNASTPGYIPFSSINTGNAAGKELTLPIDIGLGMKVDASGKVVADTALDAQTSSVKTLALNMDASGSTDLFDVIGGAVKKLRSSSGRVDLSTEIQQTQDAQSKVLKSITDIGQKTNMLDFMSDKITSDNLNQQSRLSGLEGVDMEQAIMSFQMQQMVYNASLSVGAKIIQPSLVDFLK